jgi:hypothetical protein
MQATTGAQPDDPEDRKILSLARASLARSGAEEGACVRDRNGRTYAATPVRLASLRLSAIQLAIAMAASSGASGLEAVALLAEAGPDPADLQVVREFGGPGVTVWVADRSGSVRDRVEA